nr:CBS domain-containing protein [Nitrospirota bacterium]
MPVILAVNGTVESYQPRSDGRRPKAPRPARREHEDQADQEQAPDQTLTVLAARQAYAQVGSPASRKPAILAQDIMSAPVQTLRPDTSLTEAWAFIKTHGFRHLPIAATDGTLAGILSDRDLLRCSSQLENHAAQPLQQTVATIMATQVLTATPTTEIHELARVMLAERISALPVIDNHHRPIGIVTISDILRCVMLRAPLELWT